MGSTFARAATASPAPGPEARFLSIVSVGAGGPRGRARPAFSGLSRLRLGPGCAFSRGEGRLCCGARAMSHSHPGPRRPVTASTRSTRLPNVKACVRSEARGPPPAPTKLRHAGAPPTRASTGADDRSTVRRHQKGQSALTPPDYDDDLSLFLLSPLTLLPAYKASAACQRCHSALSPPVAEAED